MIDAYTDDGGVRRASLHTAHYRILAWVRPDGTTYVTVELRGAGGFTDYTVHVHGQEPFQVVADMVWKLARVRVESPPSIDNISEVVEALNPKPRDYSADFMQAYAAIAGA